MGERVRVVRHEGGLLAAKEAGDRGPDALRAEARVLSTVQGPGVVELVGVTDVEPPSLLTRWVGSRSLADVPVPMTPERAGALCLAVAATVGRLHRSGVVHGAVDPTHVLLDRHGRPVLCGFGSAGPVGAPVRRPATDQGRADDTSPGGATLRPASDVAGLGRLLDHLLGPAIASTGAAGWSRSGRAAATRRRALRDLALHASAADPAARPSVAAFSHAVRRAVPGASLADGSTEGPDEPARSTGAPLPRPDQPPGPRRRPATTDGPARPARHGRIAAVLALVAVAATTYFGLSAWWAPSTERRADATPVAGRPTTTTSRLTTTTTTDPTTRSPSPGTAPIVEHDGRRYEVGRAGDVVAVGPWLCDGRDLPAVLHPADGTVHLFDGWAGDGGSLTARLVATVPGASALDRTDQGPDCAGLAATDAGRTIKTLTTEDLR